ncbi:MAG TPA: CHRD domain-containing protein [Actinomycetota bacterium]|nr:CHRD domain-containing protein [Actinomycetota bacterium]
MKKGTVITLLGAIGLLALLAVPTLATEGGNLKANLTGYEEVPAISTSGSGEFQAKVTTDGAAINYVLSYSGLQNAFAAHIHFGQKAVNGGVSVFLCGGGDKPACPTSEGTVTGTIDADDVIGPAGQGIAPGELGELIAALRAGVTYANVHTNDNVAPPNTGPGDFPGGEIRGQIG